MNDGNLKDISCIILSGGKSSRMKEDKSLLPFANKNSLIQYQYERLKPYFKEVYISSKENKFDFLEDEDILILDEDKSTFSPIIAMKSILEKIDEDKVFILTVDTPFISINSISIMLEKVNDCDIVVAKTQRIHSLCGFFSKSILSKVNDMLKEDIHKVGYLLQNSNTKYIGFLDDDEFINLNRPEDYQKALKIQSNYF